MCWSGGSKTALSPHMSWALRGWLWAGCTQMRLRPESWHVASPADTLRVFGLLMQLLRLTKTVPRAQGRRCRASNGTLLTVTKPHFSCNLCRQIISVQLRFRGRHHPSMREAAQSLQSSFIYHGGQWLICVCTATRRQASGWTRGYGLSATSLYSFEGQKLTF